METTEPLNFGWLVEGKVAGCSAPSREELSFLRRQGIGALVRLVIPNEGNVEKEEVEAVGLIDYHEPVEGSTAPTKEQLARVVAFISACLDGGRAVAVSCRIGRGRTGTFLAAYLVSQGLSSQKALEVVARLRPGSPETPSQREAVHQYARTLGR